MKLNKYLLGLAVVVMGGLTACNTDVEGEFYPYSTDYAQFEAASQSVSLANTEDHVTIPVSITRSNTSNALTVNFTAAASHEGIFSNDANGVVNFAPGQGTATFNVTAQNLEKEVAYQYALTLAGDPVGVLSMVQNGDTIEYEPGQRLSTVIKVQREGDWTPWAAWNSDGTADYYYMGNYWDGVDEDLKFYYRKSLTNPTQYKFRLDNWGYGVSLYLDYDDATGQVSIPSTFTGYVHSSYGNLYIADWAHYKMMNDVEPTASDYGTFDKDLGIITIPVYYYVDAGYFGNTPEYIYIDGYVRTDYSMELTYDGYLTDKNGVVYAMGDLTLSDDISTAKAIVMPFKDVDPEAVADAIASGDLEAIDVEAGQIRVPIGEDLSGELQLIVAIIEDGAVKNVKSVKFEYYAGGSTSPWKKLGVGYYTDDFVLPVYGEKPFTTEVEIEESNETPGLYRVKSAYAGIAAEYEEEGGEEDIIIHAENPNAVYFLTSPVGLDFGQGSISIISYGGDDIEYYVGKGYSEAEIIEAMPEDFGKVENGVITLPAIQAQNQDGSPRTYEDGSPYLFQGYTGLGEKYYYAGRNVAFKLVLPSAAASVKAKAKKQAMSTSKTLMNINKIMMKGMSRKQMHLGLSKKSINKHVKVFKR